MNLYDLVAEYKKNPLGIDVEKPRLSWKIAASENNVLQNACRIQAAASVEELEKEANLLWDSGKVESSQSIHIEYAGEELKSGERAYWRVKVWTGESESEWSHGTDFWEMGLLDSGDWKAQWISTTAEDDLTKACPVPMFRKEFAAAKKITSARVYVTSLGIYELRINGERVGDALFTPGWTSYNKRLQYQTYDVTDLLNEGGNAIAATVGDGWSTTMETSWPCCFNWSWNMKTAPEKRSLPTIHGRTPPARFARLIFIWEKPMMPGWKSRAGICRAMTIPNGSALSCSTMRKIS